MSLLARSALALSTFAEIIVAAVPENFVAAAARELESVDAEVHIVVGGATRQDSVAAALRILPTDIDLVLIHDAARPLVPQSVIGNVLTELRSGAQAVIPVLPVSDTIKRVANNGIVLETVDRDSLRRVQTPQGFVRSVLADALSEAIHVATDEAGLVENFGVSVHTVAGSELAFKITTPEDVSYGLFLLQEA